MEESEYFNSISELNLVHPEQEASGPLEGERCHGAVVPGVCHPEDAIEVVVRDLPAGKGGPGVGGLTLRIKGLRVRGSGFGNGARVQVSQPYSKLLR